MTTQEKLVAATEAPDLWHVAYTEPVETRSALGTPVTGNQTIVISVADAVNSMRHVIHEAQTVKVMPPDTELLHEFLIVHMGALYVNANMLYNSLVRVYIPLSVGGSPIWEDTAFARENVRFDPKEHTTIVSGLLLYPQPLGTAPRPKLLAV